MREIKFRAWSTIKNNGNMIYINNAGHLSDLQATDEWRVMQYTGFKDKQGKEIYEGDIIKSECSHPCEILWLDYGWGLKFSDSENIDTEYLDEIVMDDDWEIIGNIYENPELLNG